VTGKEFRTSRAAPVRAGAMSGLPGPESSRQTPYLPSYRWYSLPTAATAWLFATLLQATQMVGCTSSHVGVGARQGHGGRKRQTRSLLDTIEGISARQLCLTDVRRVTEARPLRYVCRLVRVFRFAFAARPPNRTCRGKLMKSNLRMFAQGRTGKVLPLAGGGQRAARQVPTVVGGWAAPGRVREILRQRPLVSSSSLVQRL
jgi:hypothetical protein